MAVTRLETPIVNPAMSELIDVLERSAVPEGHISSHWRRYGQETTARREGDRLILEAAGFSSQRRPTLAERAFNVVERLSYVRVTRRLKSYDFVRAEAARLSKDLSRGLETSPGRRRWFWAARLSHERIFTTALAVLIDHFREYDLTPTTFVLIGDGDGFFGALIRRCIPKTTLYCIDLPKMLVFQACTHQKANPEATLALFRGHDVPAGRHVVFVQPQDIDGIAGPIDCAINISSMQEMNRFSIETYFSFLRRRGGPRSRFYCVNHARKELVGGEVLEFSEYPWAADDEIFLDGPCPYFTHYFAPHTLSYGPRLFNRIRVPGLNDFGGLILHRLVRLAARS